MNPEDVVDARASPTRHPLIAGHDLSRKRAWRDRPS
jgi:hypothetical protein